MKTEKYPFPSHFGSHRSMLVRVNARQWAEGTVTLADEFGKYETFRSRMDNGTADPKRYSKRGFSA